MGTKFANVHVQTGSIEELLNSLREVAEIQANVKPNLQMFFGENNNPAIETLNIMNGSKNVYYIGEFRNGWFSVLNDWFAWGGVEAFGEKLSSMMKSTILTVSYFDDEILEINFFKDGRQLTGHIWCSEETKEAYDIEMKYGDITIIKELLEIQDINEINKIFEHQDCEQAAEELQDAANLPLCMHSDWLDEIEDKEFMDRFIKYELNH